MNECKNCIGFVRRGSFCDDCKNRSIDNKLKCVACHKYENIRLMKWDICGDCGKTHEFNKCMYCDKYEIISLIHNMCDKCINNRCCYCLNTQNNCKKIPRYSWVFGDIVCKTCRSIEGKGNYICEHTHSLCSSQKYKCCVCKDERIYEKDCMNYKGYLDTVGTVYNLSRWHHYCPQCKETCEVTWNNYNSSKN